MRDSWLTMKPKFHLVGLWLTAITGWMSLAGCSEAQLDRAVKKILSRPSPRQRILIALEASHPDTRREALRGLVKRKEVSEDWAVKAMDVIARTDSDSQVRCVALRGLMRSGSVVGIETALAILEPGLSTRPARTGEADVRLDAVALLAEHLSAGTVPADRKADLGRVIRRAALDDTDRQVRMAAIRALRYLPSQQTLTMLVGVLQQSDFGLAYEAEMSLRALTGHVGNFEAESWHAWLEKTPEPLAGRLVQKDQRGSRGRFWRKMADALNTLWEAWQGPTKPTGKPSAVAARQAENERIGSEPVE